jgi:hypothetical protein
LLELVPRAIGFVADKPPICVVDSPMVHIEQAMAVRKQSLRPANFAGISDRLGKIAAAPEAITAAATATTATTASAAATARAATATSSANRTNATRIVEAATRVCLVSAESTGCETARAEAAPPAETADFAGAAQFGDSARVKVELNTGSVAKENDVLGIVRHPVDVRRVSLEIATRTARTAWHVYQLGTVYIDCKVTLIVDATSGNSLPEIAKQPCLAGEIAPYDVVTFFLTAQ